MDYSQTGFFAGLRLTGGQGNIGSTEGGLPFLEDEEILEVIVEIAHQSPVLTMKGYVVSFQLRVRDLST